MDISTDIAELEMLARMTPQERTQLYRAECIAEKQREIDSLIEEYNLNKDILQVVDRIARRYGSYVREALESGEEEVVIQYVADIKLCKHVMLSTAEDQRRIRKRIKEVRGYKHGT